MVKMPELTERDRALAVLALAQVGGEPSIEVLESCAEDTDAGSEEFRALAGDSAKSIAARLASESQN